MLKELCLNQMQRHRNYETLVRPLPEVPHIRDAEFYIRSDGILFNADGYAHPDSVIVGGALYAPDAHGEKIFFGVHYRKTTLLPGTYDPIPYADRARHFRLIDPELDQVGRNPFPFTYEHMLPHTQFVGFIPADHAYRCAVGGLLEEGPERLLRDMESLRSLFPDLYEYEIGLTGALALGQINGYHDLDIMFRGDAQANRQLADTMRMLLTEEPERRLHEGGKNWLIRFYSGETDGKGTLFCCFFGYKDIEDAPLKEFIMNVLISDVEIEGSVKDATHALYTPSIVTLHDVTQLSIDGRVARGRLPDDLPLIIYHTGSRGELNKKDRVWAHGALTEVITPETSYQAIVVIEREGVRNETPPWPDYYTWERI